MAKISGGEEDNINMAYQLKMKKMKERKAKENGAENSKNGEKQWRQPESAESEMA